MSSPRRQRFARRLLTTRFCCVAGALLSTTLLFIGPATAWAEEEPITLDFVRHGESGDMSVINTMVPGPPLTDLGQQQAQDVANSLAGNNIDAIFASEMIRSQETAAPLATLLGLNVQDLPGLNEINAGIFEGIPVNVGDIPLGGGLYLLAPFLWTLGLVAVPELGSTDPNGIAFDESFGGAIQTIYNESVANGDSNTTDAVFSHEGAIAIWTLMNVNNPDFSLLLTQLLNTGEVLPYTGTVVVTGDPEDGWTLVSFDGQPVPQDPGLPTELFVDMRNLIEAPQFAAYNIQEAFLTGDPTTIMNAIQTGVSEVSTATAQFPVAVIDDIVNALNGGIPNVGTDLASALPTATADLAGLLPGELSAMVGDVIPSL